MQKYTLLWAIPIANVMTLAVVGRKILVMTCGMVWKSLLYFFLIFNFLGIYQGCIAWGGKIKVSKS